VSTEDLDVASQLEIAGRELRAAEGAADKLLKRLSAVMRDASNAPHGDTQMIRLLAEEERRLREAMVSVRQCTLRMMDAAGAYREEFKRLRDSVERDPVTGLLNRAGFERVLRSTLESAVPLVLVYLDVDWFKQINDEYGHLAGDDALRTVGAALAAGIRGDDVVSRMGGDEFAVLLRGVSLQTAEEVVSRLLAMPRTESGVRITMSAGLAMRRRGDDVRSICLRADEALYRAKRAGRHRLQSVS